MRAKILTRNIKHTRYWQGMLQTRRFITLDEARAKVSMARMENGNFTWFNHEGDN